MRHVFYRGWVRKLFHKPAWTDAVAAAWGVGIGIAGHFWPQSLITQNAWLIPALGLASLVIVRVFAAPYELWSEQKDRADALEQDEPLYSSWDDLIAFRLFQAASLWGEKAPPTRYEDGLYPCCEPILQSLVYAVEKQIIAIYNDTYGSIWHSIPTVDGRKEVPPSISVSRDALLQYALQMKQRPKFLFKDVR